MGLGNVSKGWKKRILCPVCNDGTEAKLKKDVPGIGRARYYECEYGHRLNLNGDFIPHPAVPAQETDPRWARMGKNKRNLNLFKQNSTITYNTAHKDPVLKDLLKRFSESVRDRFQGRLNFTVMSKNLTPFSEKIAAKIKLTPKIKKYITHDVYDTLYFEAPDIEVKIAYEKLPQEFLNEYRDHTLSQAGAIEPNDFLNTFLNRLKRKNICPITTSMFWELLEYFNENLFLVTRFDVYEGREYIIINFNYESANENVDAFDKLTKATSRGPLDIRNFPPNSASAYPRQRESPPVGYPEDGSQPFGPHRPRSERIKSIFKRGGDAGGNFLASIPNLLMAILGLILFSMELNSFGGGNYKGNWLLYVAVGSLLVIIAWFVGREEEKKKAKKEDKETEEENEELEKIKAEVIEENEEIKTARENVDVVGKESKKDNLVCPNKTCRGYNKHVLSFDGKCRYCYSTLVEKKPEGGDE